MNQAIAVTLGVGFLVLFYRTIKSSWPESYFMFGSTTDPIISRSLDRYLAYRTLPYFVVCLFIAVTLSRQGVNALPATIATPLLHTVPLFLVSLIADRRKRGTPPGHVALRVAVVALSVLAGYLAYLSRNTLDGLVPPLSDLTTAVWTGLFAAVIGAALLEMSAIAALEPRKMVAGARAHINADLFDLARHTAARYSAEPLLVEAIMIVEDAQRPGWVRWLERVRGKVQPSGSYGVMQVRASSPLTDAESIEVACRDFLKGAAIQVNYSSLEQAEGLRDPLAYPWVEKHSLAAALHRYNGTSDYVELVGAVIDELLSGQRLESIAEALRRAAESPRWEHLTSERKLEALAQESPDSYTWFLRWINGGPSGDLRGRVAETAPRLEALLSQVDMTKDSNSDLGKAWIAVVGFAAELRDLAKSAGLVEWPFTSDPELQPAMPDPRAPAWREEMWLAATGSPMSDQRVFAAKISMSVPVGGVVWIGGYAGPAIASGDEFLGTWDFSEVTRFSWLVAYSGTDDVAEIRSKLAQATLTVSDAAGPAWTEILGLSDWATEAPENGSDPDM